MNDELQTPQPAAADPYAGQGGSYVLDPATGLRTLIERTTDSAPAEPAPEPQSTEE